MLSQYAPALLILVLAILALVLYLRYRAGVLRYRSQVRDLTDEMAEIRADVFAFNSNQRKEIKTIRKERRRREEDWKNETISL